MSILFGIREAPMPAAMWYVIMDGFIFTMLIASLSRWFWRRLHV